MQGPLHPIFSARNATTGNPTLKTLIHALSSNDYVASLNFQVCASGTLNADAVNPWSVFPVAKACVEVPWFYAVFFWFASFLVVYLFILLVRVLVETALWLVRRFFEGIISWFVGFGEGALPAQSEKEF